MNRVSLEKDHFELKESLRRCSSQTVEAAIRYRETGDVAEIPLVVMGILERYQPASAPVKLAGAREDMRLMEELGLDSLTLLEIVMSIEEALKVQIQNDELREIRTLGHLNQFLRRKITGDTSTMTACHFNREQIILTLPQQPPFLFLDSAELDDASAKGRYLIRGDEFFLEGHFKDEPVFPASLVFEALGQTACLWLLEKAPAKTGNPILSNHVYFASLDGAHFHRKARPGEQLEFEVKLAKLREPLAIFEGVVTIKGERIAQIERLVLAFGDPLQADKPIAELAASRNGHHNGHH